MNKITMTGGKIGGLAITIDGDPVRHIERHSPDGMQVGYAGSGPADCARSILIHMTSQETADRLYQQFKREIVAGWKHPGGTTHQEIDIIAWIEKALKRIDK